MSDEKKRCFGSHQPFYAHYHDTEWGVPVHDDQKLFELLILEGAQAGLNWETILKRREGYRDAFCHFDPKAVACMSDDTLHELTKNPGIIRHRLKIFGARLNAQVFLKIQQEFGSFDHYLWAFVDFKPIISPRQTWKDVPVSTPQSIALSKDLKKRGMKFVGPTIMYAFMQATGLVNDHLRDCICSEGTS